MNSNLSDTNRLFRFYYLFSLIALFLVINILVRLIFPVIFPETLPFSASIFTGLAKGFFNDLLTAMVIIIIPAILVLLPPSSFMQRKTGKTYYLAILFIYSFIFLFTAVSEYFFWDEFNARFNFIAVDYLIYTTELLQNMVESYPLTWIIAGIFLATLGTTALLWKLLHTSYVLAKNSSTDTWKKRLTALVILFSIATAIVLLAHPFTSTENRFLNEYSKNGVYELFSAYKNNQLNYRSFYKTLPSQEVNAIINSELLNKNITTSNNTAVQATEPQPAIKPNVIIVIMESMGSRWLGEYTPNLNTLAAEGLSFSNMHATGTRTIRGIEAIMLSIPPTPGNSIVRRPNNGNLFNTWYTISAKRL